MALDAATRLVSTTQLLFYALLHSSTWRVFGQWRIVQWGLCALFPNMFTLAQVALASVARFTEARESFYVAVFGFVALPLASVFITKAGFPLAFVHCITL